MCGRAEGRAGTTSGRIGSALGMQVRTFWVQCFPHPQQLLTRMELKLGSVDSFPQEHREQQPVLELARQGMTGLSLPACGSSPWAGISSSWVSQNPRKPRETRLHPAQSHVGPGLCAEGLGHRQWAGELLCRFLLPGLACVSFPAAASVLWECCWILALDPANWACTQAKQANMKL